MKMRNVSHSERRIPSEARNANIFVFSVGMTNATV
jgi:hypothetical protein